MKKRVDNTTLEEQITQIPISELHPFPNHPFKVLDDERMAETVGSIHAHGVLLPIIVRPVENGYEIISGHRRKRACELLGMETMRCEIVEMSRDESIVVMVDSNLQRTSILPSEKAKAYKMRLEAIKRLVLFALRLAHEELIDRGYPGVYMPSRFPCTQVPSPPFVRFTIIDGYVSENLQQKSRLQF